MRQIGAVMPKYKTASSQLASPNEYQGAKSAAAMPYVGSDLTADAL